MSSLRRFVLAAVVVLCAAPVAAEAANLAVAITNPPLNGMGPATTTIAVTFDRAVALGQFNDDRFRVFGRGTGTKSGTFALSNANQTVTFTPSTPFSAGEIVMVNLKNDLVATDASPMRSAGYAFQFTVAAQAGSMDFAFLNTMPNRTGGPGGPHTQIYGAQATDLNHDGYLDLATVNEVTADVRVALNTANGSGLYFPFLTPQSIGLESSPNEQADFDNDGDTDGVFSAAQDGGQVRILKGDGDGTYGSSQTITLGGAPHGVAVLDVDGDADWDIVDARVDGDNLALMLNDGNGNFGAPSFFDAGVGGEYGLQAADMNNDGIMDLVVAARNSEEVRTLLGNGNGTFTGGAIQDSGGNTWVVAVGDLDNDGDLDVTAANDGDANGAVLFNDGTGDFAPPIIYGSDAHTPSTDLGDLDGDGDLDWILSVYGAGKWIMFENDGSGSFTEVQEFFAPSNPSCAIMLDFDNDGDIDLALTDEIADVVVLQENVGIGVPQPTPGCAPAPEPCRTPTVGGKSQLQLQDRVPNDKDRLSWKWSGGAATSKAEFGNPVTTDAFDLCIYDNGALVASQSAPQGGVCAGRACWAEKTKSFDYKDKEYTPSRPRADPAQGRRRREGGDPGEGAGRQPRSARARSSDGSAGRAAPPSRRRHLLRQHLQRAVREGRRGDVEGQGGLSRARARLAVSRARRASSSGRRRQQRPRLQRFEPRGRRQHAEIVVAPSDDLQSDRRPADHSGGHRHRGVAAQVEDVRLRDGRERADGALADRRRRGALGGERRDRCRREQEQIDVLEQRGERLHERVADERRARDVPHAEPARDRQEEAQHGIDLVLAGGDERRVQLDDVGRHQHAPGFLGIGDHDGRVGRDEPGALHEPLRRGADDARDVRLAGAEPEIRRPRRPRAAEIERCERGLVREAGVREREGVVLVGADDGIQDARGVGDAAGEHAVVPDVRHADVARPARHAAVGAFEPDEPRERRRDAERSARVRAGRERDEPERHRRCRTTARAARRARRVPRVSADPVEHRRRERPGAHLGRRGEPDGHRARVAEPAHVRRGGLRDHVGEHERTALMRPPGDVLELLHAERYARERPGILAARDGGVDCIGGSARAIGVRKHERPDRRIEACDAVEVVVEHLAGAERAAADGVGERGDGARVKRRAHAAGAACDVIGTSRCASRAASTSSCLPRPSISASRPRVR